MAASSIESVPAHFPRRLGIWSGCPDRGNGGESGPLALDLFAGVGLFTLPLAGKFEQVVAVEVHPCAVADLQANAESYGFEDVRAVQQMGLDYPRRFAQAGPVWWCSAPDVPELGPGR